MQLLFAILICDFNLRTFYRYTNVINLRHELLLLLPVLDATPAEQRCDHSEHDRDGRQTDQRCEPPPTLGDPQRAQAPAPLAARRRSWSSDRSGHLTVAFQSGRFISFFRGRVFLMEHISQSSRGAYLMNVFITLKRVAKYTINIQNKHAISK